MPLLPLSEAAFSESDRIIIIHPGSLYLQIGRASDIEPFCVLNAIARRRKPNGKVYRENILPPCNIKDEVDLKKIEESRLKISHYLQGNTQSNGVKRYATPPQQISAFNRRSLPEKIEQNEGDRGILDDKPVNWYSTTDETVFDELILQLNPNDEYNLHFPIKRGHLNLHSDIGGSMYSVINDIKCIWEYALQEKLLIDLEELDLYQVVLVIPDIYKRKHLRELMDLLLDKMGFANCILIQDHVAATFGAGVPTACVVDIGDQKVSISCVEDAISHSETRVRFEYGGADITQTFHWLLLKSAFPYKECNDKSPLDVWLLKTLKEEFCHLNMDICGSDEKAFDVIQPDKEKYRYTLQIGDECVLAPFGLFFPQILNITGMGKKIVTQRTAAEEPNAEDTIDAEYIRETGRKSKDHALDHTNVLVTADGTHAEDDVDVLECDDKGDVKPFKDGDNVIGLDEAILQSIERCSNEEIRRKMYSSILVIGGGMKFNGFDKILRKRLTERAPLIFHSGINHSIFTYPRGMDPIMITWKGAAIMSCLESVSELWISADEYSKTGIRILREKSIFIW